jgi:ubiquinone/menaquinone biosynthesis C-methylase UbiE
MSEAALFATMSFPEIYERMLVGPLFRPFAEDLIARLNPGRQDRLLDVACGTGIVARVARERMGAAAPIVGVDASPQMLAVARRVDPTIDWREGNAMALPVHEGERFSLLTCHQGLQFFADKTAAVLQMRRVLLPEGRVAIGTWRPLAELACLRELHPIAEQQLGPVVDARHSFGDADELARLLIDADFGDVQVETISHDVRMPDGMMFARLNATALASMSANGKTMTEADRQQAIERIVNNSAATIAKYSRAGALVIELSANVATAAREARR